VGGFAVGVASELSEVLEQGVGAFNGPSGFDSVWAAGFGLTASLLTHHVGVVDPGVGDEVVNEATRASNQPAMCTTVRVLGRFPLDIGSLV